MVFLIKGVQLKSYYRIVNADHTEVSKSFTILIRVNKQQLVITFDMPFPCGRFKIKAFAS